MKPRLKLRVANTAKRHRLRAPDTGKSLKFLLPTEGIRIEIEL